VIAGIIQKPHPTGWGFLLSGSPVGRTHPGHTSPGSVNRGPSGLGCIEEALFLSGSGWQSQLEGTLGELEQWGCTEADAAVSVF